MTLHTGHFQSMDVRWGAVILSCLFSLLVIASNPIPNDDAFRYLRAAQLYADQGLSATLSTYGWYGYSVLIALLSPVVPGDLVNSAHLLNMLAMALLVYAFITLATEYRQSRHVQWFAAIIILCFPTLNELRYNLIRDFAYWAFCLVALVQLIRFNRTGATIHAGGWLLAMTAAIFFRLEGLLILLVSPFSLLFWHKNPIVERWQQVATLFLFMLAGTIVVLLLFLPASVNLVDVFRFAYRWYLPLLSSYPDTLAGAATSEQVSVHLSGQLALFTGKGIVVLVIGYLYAVITNLVMAVGPAASAFLAYGFVTRQQTLPSHSRGLWLFFLASALFALLIFVSIMQFLTTRYAIMAALLLLSVMPLCLDNLYQRAHAAGSLKKFRIVTAACACFFLLDSLVSFGYSKRYIEEAIDWTRNNIEQAGTVSTNNFAVAYYSRRVPDFDEVETDPLLLMGKAVAPGYLILDLPQNNQAARAAIAGRNDLTELARFANTRDDAIVIYRVTP